MKRSKMQKKKVEWSSDSSDFEEPIKDKKVSLPFAKILIRTAFLIKKKTLMKEIFLRVYWMMRT